MSDHFDKTIAEMQKTLADQEAEVLKTKEMINRLCDFAGRSPIYSDAELNPTIQSGVIRSDEFYGKPLATCVRKILEMRNNSGAGPATVRELFETLQEGGYQFDTKSDANAMRGLRISLSKNVSTFHKLPNGQFGLLKWYPKVKAGKKNDDLGDDDKNGIESETSDDENTE